MLIVVKVKKCSSWQSWYHPDGCYSENHFLGGILRRSPLNYLTICFDTGSQGRCCWVWNYVRLRTNVSLELQCCSFLKGRINVIGLCDASWFNKLRDIVRLSTNVALWFRKWNLYTASQSDNMGLCVVILTLLIITEEWGKKKIQSVGVYPSWWVQKNEIE